MYIRLKSLSIIVLVINTIVFSQQSMTYSLVIHGGAGNFDSSTFNESEYDEYFTILEAVIDFGDSLLASGVFAIDVVELCAIMLEDSPLFNAGKGAVMNNNGDFELDASIMDGRDLNAGAVAGISIIKNPIRAARAVMEKSPHVLLSGRGAEQFAVEVGLDVVKSEYFETQRIKERYERQKKEDMGTIGVVALDIHGNLAAATSTGGMMMKKYGRIGDSPIIGAGTYADNNFAAVSCTGHGEYFIRGMAAYNVIAMIKYAGLNLDEATEKTIIMIEDLGGYGGLIAVDKNGEISMPFNTKSMFRAYIKSSGEKEILF
jgi:L-asparaginase / beta-aspartyl-peptidase